MRNLQKVYVLKITNGRVPRVSQIGGRTFKKNERMKPTRRARYKRKCPYRGPSVLVHWGLRCVRRMLDSQYAQPWGQPDAGPSRRPVRLGHCIAYCTAQNLWGPSGT